MLWWNISPLLSKKGCLLARKWKTGLQMHSRRKFIKNSVLATGSILVGSGIYNNVEAAGAAQKLTILHTNDVHSRLEPFPMDGGRNQGQGGVAGRAHIINEIRRQEEHVLLLDAGDIFQGTPYFNFYKGEPEIKAMSRMGYDATTMGNHDFDAGLDNFATQLKHASFPILLCNYDFTATPMENKFLPYKIIQKGRLKIGITGAGIELKGLVPDLLYGNTKYLDPVQETNKVAEYMKRKKSCDMVICLSHLGYQYKDNTVSDVILAKESEYIDLIIGGHTHTFLDNPVVYKNKKGDDIVVNQVGWAGILLGRLDYIFQPSKRGSLTNGHSVVIGKKTRE
jgi:5'-nucleotidase